MQYRDPSGTVWVKDTSNNRIWIPDDKWDAVSHTKDKNGNTLYTLLTNEELEYDSVTGQRVRLEPFGPNENNPRGWSFIGPNQGSGVLAGLAAAGGTALFDGPEPGPADLFGLAIACYVVYEVANTIRYLHRLSLTRIAVQGAGQTHQAQSQMLLAMATLLTKSVKSLRR